MLYFDHNATAPLSPAARDAWLEAQARTCGNPASQHRPGQRAELALGAARDAVASHIGASPAQIIWTSGATEAANSVLAHLAAEAPPDSRLWISSQEHPCLREAALRWFPNRILVLPAEPNGQLSLGFLKERLCQAPCQSVAGIAVMAANNETGVLQPWQTVQGLCAERRIPYVCDATQWLGRLTADDIGRCDYVIASGHKWGAPVGVGFLKTPNSRFRALLAGGPQEDGRRAGTQNVAGAAAFAAALQDCATRFDAIPERRAWRDAFEERARQLVPGLQVVGGDSGRLWNTSLVVPPPLADCRMRWLVRLDAAGIAASSGSACASGKEKPSEILTALGLPAEVSDRALRFSSGWSTSQGDWEGVAVCLFEIVKKFGLEPAKKTGYLRQMRKKGP